MDATGFFSPVGEEDIAFSDLHQWVEWERDRMREQVAKDGFVITENVRLFLQFGEYVFREVGKGVLTIRDGYAEYSGSQCLIEEGIEYKKGKPIKRLQLPEDQKHYTQVKKEFPVDRLRGLKISYGKLIELIEPGGMINRFIPENPQRMFEMQTAIQAMQEQQEQV
jgi:hypothetical protein